MTSQPSKKAAKGLPLAPPLHLLAAPLLPPPVGVALHTSLSWGGATAAPRPPGGGIDLATLPFYFLGTFSSALHGPQQAA